MTYIVNVPNTNQSPSVFPAQSNENFSRLKSIINSDHNFTDSTSASEGAHRQVTTINRTSPGSLDAGTNLIMYSKDDASGDPQLNVYNGVDDYQIISPPQKIYGNTTLEFTFPLVVFTTSNKCHGTIFCVGTGVTSYYQFWKTASTQTVSLISGSILDLFPSWLSSTQLNIAISATFAPLSVDYYLVINEFA